MNVDKFISRVAWPGVRPSPSGGGEASATQEPMPEEDEPIPPEPFVYETDASSAQEEVASPEPVPQSSLATVLDDMPEPSTPTSVPDQSISQDPLSAPVLDLNEHAKDYSQDD